MAERFKILLWLETGRGYDRQILRGIARYSKIYGPWRFFTNPNPKKLVGLVKNWQADGVICIHPQTMPFSANKIIHLGIPAILASEGNIKSQKIVQTVSNNVTLGRFAADHLIGCGFRNFAFCPSVNKPWLVMRGHSFGQRVTENGFDFYSYKPPKSKRQQLWENEQFLLTDWLMSLPKPVGIMSDLDERSAQVMEACKTADLSVPSDVAIIGVDNDDLICELSYCPLSSIALNAESVGFEAAKMLSEIIKGKKPSKNKIVIEPLYVVTRCSTDTVAIKDDIISRAMQFIKDNSKRVIQVDDIVDAVGVSRRVLYERFKKVVGRTPYDEIRVVRNKEIAKMLVETDLSISEIAMALGYNNVAHIARMFKQQMGMSTLSFRRKYKSINL